MATINVSELSCIALDFAVAQCEGKTIKLDPMGFKSGPEAGYWIWEDDCRGEILQIGRNYSPSTSWTSGGPILEKKMIGLRQSQVDPSLWLSIVTGQATLTGPTQLVCCMRAYVASVLGMVIDIPDLLVMEIK